MHNDQATANFLVFFFLFVIVPISGMAAVFVAAIKNDRTKN